MIPFRNGPGVIATSTGYFDLAAPRPEDVDLGDIALALSRLARFTGQGARVYSVAAHSAWCAGEAARRGLSVDLQRLALMHDAAEAYVGDVSRPLKLLLPAFKEIEAGVWRAICARFDLPEDLPAEIKEIDNLALATEAAAMFPRHAPWPGFPAPSPVAIRHGDAGADREFFLDVADALGLLGR